MLTNSSLWSPERPLSGGWAAQRRYWPRRVNRTRNWKNKVAICVFTDDFTDKADIKRVMNELERLGLIKLSPYLPDVHVQMGVMAGNQYKITPGIYL
ncbi:hypothetical protein TrLO_g14888 [Triparma laevis f. longispina]|uniref:Uncharacterized protein n=1 Tax=Triparma laevis f. longispina TaxID=1714387 RepID=A0A9W7FV36_9STRA|nr:hypothetical protein TrLO_g14888 [Triparma laevis f. longispina]